MQSKQPSVTREPSVAREPCATKQPSATKKPYNKPVIKLYGNVSALTFTVSNSSPTMDGGSGTKNRTH
jgi:hypothetical protein